MDGKYSNRCCDKDNHKEGTAKYGLRRKAKNNGDYFYCPTKILKIGKVLSAAGPSLAEPYATEKVKKGRGKPKNHPDIEQCQGLS